MPHPSSFASTRPPPHAQARSGKSSPSDSSRRMARAQSQPHMRKERQAPAPMPSRTELWARETAAAMPTRTELWARSTADALASNPDEVSPQESGPSGHPRSLAAVPAPSSRQPLASGAVPVPSKAKSTMTGASAPSGPDAITLSTSPKKLMGKISRALKGETEDEARAREWEEARERQNEWDRRERNIAKARQAAEESRLRQNEAAELARRKKAAAKVEQERKAREAEAERLRAEERRRKEKIRQRHEEELRNREEMQRRQEEEEKRRARKAAEEAEAQRERQRLAALAKAEAERQAALAKAEEERLQRERKIQEEKQAAERKRQKELREAEARRLKAQREAEAKRKAEARERARIKALEDAEKARLKAIEDAEKARIKAIEDAEKARLKAIEDERRAIEKAKQDLIRALAEGHDAVEREDRELIERAQTEAAHRSKQHNRIFSDNSDGPQLSSDSGVSIPSSGHEGDVRPMPNLASPQHSPQLGGDADNVSSAVAAPPRPQRSMTDGPILLSQTSRPAPTLQPALPRPQRSASQGDQGIPPEGMPWPDNSLKATNVSPPTDAPTTNPILGVRFADSPQKHTVQLPARKAPRSQLPSLRFASALTNGARGPPSNRSPRTLEPAIRPPWDASAVNSQDSNPSALAQIASEASVADIRDPTRPVQGEGWFSHGVGDRSLIPSHYQVLKMDNIRLVKRPVARKRGADDSSSSEYSSDDSDTSDEADEVATAPSQADDQEFEEVWEEYVHEVLIFDLFEQLFTSDTPQVVKRIFSHLDCADVKALRQSCREVRYALDEGVGRELVLRRFLEPVGYRTWEAGSSSDVSSKDESANQDPLPLNFSDIEGLLLSPELSPEYAQVANDWLQIPHEMDCRVPRLARGSTRAYSRVLTRLRAQPVFKIPPNATLAHTPSRSTTGSSDASSQPTRRLSSVASVPNLNSRSKVPQSPQQRSRALDTNAVPGLRTSASPTRGVLVSPWRPGRAAVHRVWVPCRDGVWLSDEEIARCERELFLAGIWNHLQRGDIVWNTAMGEQGNIGKVLFDGRYLRDLSHMYDPIGHLPSWLNMALYSPGHYHNIVKSSTPNPVLYLDVLPWREQLLSSMRLVQDQVETTIAATGARYRIAKWLYRAVASVKAGHIISSEGAGLQCADEGWAGRIVIETEGTPEHAKDLVSRCIRPNASPHSKAKLLAAVLGGGGVEHFLRDPAIAGAGAGEKDGDAPQEHEQSTAKRPGTDVVNAGGGAAVQNRTPVQHSREAGSFPTPFAVLRERSRPGLIWLRPLMERDRVN